MGQWQHIFTHMQKPISLQVHIQSITTLELTISTYDTTIYLFIFNLHSEKSQIVHRYPFIELWISGTFVYFPHLFSLPIKYFLCKIIYHGFFISWWNVQGKKIFQNWYYRLMLQALWENTFIGWKLALWKVFI